MPPFVPPPIPSTDLASVEGASSFWRQAFGECVITCVPYVPSSDILLFCEFTDDSWTFFTMRFLTWPVESPFAIRAKLFWRERRIGTVLATGFIVSLGYLASFQWVQWVRGHQINKQCTVFLVCAPALFFLIQFPTGSRPTRPPSIDLVFRRCWCWW